ncbi:MAG: magnesium and cobalt transport protein CorA [Nocardioides sp.]
MDLRSSRSFLEARRSVLSHGPSAVLYAVCDLVVDGYEAVAGSLEIDVDEVEASVFSEQRTRDSARIYRLKRELAEMRRAVVPLRDPLRRFAAGQVPGVDLDSAPFFRDVADHLARVWESIESLDGLLSYAFDAHLASISVHQNEDMRKISAWVAIIAAPTLVAGIYGMNFAHMPELGWHWGYPYSLLLMLVLMIALWIVFKRSGWL